MKIAKLYLRFVASIIDILFLLIFVMFGASYLTKFLNVSETYFQVLPFIIMEATIFPLGILMELLDKTHNLSSYILIICSLFSVEVFYNFILHLLPTKATLGQQIMGIKIYNIQGSNWKCSLLRAVTKVCSRYLLIPLVISLFNEKKQTLHDIISKTVVICSEQDVK